ncbi:ferritin family protein [Fusibacter sp. JL216-2]|uniref:ferritin family protein n=1 Tax=Fusibacter sp. JL216-2 TaxID=3071453 RepID=UPI003D333D3A
MSERFILEDLLNGLIELEDTGNKLYTSLSEKTLSDDVSSLFKKLADQEMKHKEIYQSYKMSLVPKEIVDEDYLSYIKVMLQKNIQFLNIIKAPNDLEASICQAVQLEKDTIIFLMEMKKITRSHHQTEIDEIIAEERKHLQYLYELDV